MTTPLLDITLQSGTRLQLLPTPLPAQAELLITPPAAKRGKDQTPEVSVLIDRMELHALYHAIPRAWSHMDEAGSLTLPMPDTKTPAAGQVSPNPEPVAG